MPEHPHMSIKEFVEQGYLQEANRCFFHPLGLELAVDVIGSRDPEEHTLFVQDHRNVPEGARFADGTLDVGKQQFVTARLQERAMARQQVHGWVVQPTEAGV